MNDFNIDYFMLCVGQEFRKEKKGKNKKTKIIGQNIGKLVKVLNEFERGVFKKLSVYTLKLYAIQLEIPLCVLINRAEASYYGIEQTNESNHTINTSIELQNQDVEQLVYNVGETLREIREEKGYRQIDLAKKIGITKQTYSSYERITRVQISLYKIAEICNELDISVYEVIYRAEKRLYEDLKSRK
ncbi:helix-turn-helix domain-containing protein [Staphylococcus cohnii]|uniref:helix-turn-helix domain-containing protein n=1 Tax=Staphylococcus cohnii TaxID=29382 RepID=UPI003D7D5EA5